MDSKGTYKVQKSAKVLMSDQHYFNYVFKKTEKIVGTVFYILHNHTDIKDSKISLVSDIAQAAKDTLEALTETLALERHEATGTLIKAVAALVRLESYIGLGRAAGIFSQDAGDVLDAEIEGVTRSISRYTEEDLAVSVDGSQRGSGATRSVFSGHGHYGHTGNARETASRASAPRRAPGVGGGAGVGTGSRGAGASGSSRQEQIRDIIMDKKTVSIKDISEDIKDCSEKTIQRELNNMIEKGLIKREGERRWSRYSLI